MNTDVDLSERHLLMRDVVMRAFTLVGHLRAHFDRLAAEMDLTPMQARALHNLGEPRSMSDLADMLHCDASNVTGIADRLEERGLIERRPDPGDRRRKRLVVTPAGVDLHRAMRTRIVEGHPFNALGDDELAALRDLLDAALAATAPAETR